MEAVSSSGSGFDTAGELSEGDEKEVSRERKEEMAIWPIDDNIIPFGKSHL
jgi:hypothetical protein